MSEIYSVSASRGLSPPRLHLVSPHVASPSIPSSAFRGLVFALLFELSAAYALYIGISLCARLLAQR